MPHLLFPGHENPTLPTFLSLWQGRLDEKVMQKERYKHDYGEDLDEPETARKGTSWNNLADFEEQFCVEPRIAVHYFSQYRQLWRLTDPKQPDDPDPTFIHEFSSFKEVAHHLVRIGFIEEQTLFPNGIIDRIPVEEKPQSSNKINHEDTGSRNGKTNGNQDHSTQPEREPTERATALHPTPPPPASHTGTTPTNPPTEPGSQNAVYPLDLLLRLRQTYRTQTSEDAQSFQAALQLTRTHPRNNVQKNANHTLFQRFDPSQPTASLRAVYRPKLCWSIEMQGKNNVPIPLPSILTSAPQLHSLLQNWSSFKNHLPLYQDLILPSSYPATKGFVLIDEAQELKQPPPLLTFETATQLNALLDPDSPAQKTLIKACLHQSRKLEQENRHNPVNTSNGAAHTELPKQHKSEPRKLQAFAYSLNLKIHPNPRQENQLPPIDPEQAITLLSIGAPQNMGRASLAQEILYHRITNALRQNPLTQQQREAIARDFPRTCQNQGFINWAIKISGILPTDPQAQANLVTLACEKADSRLLGAIFQLARDAGVKIQINRQDLANLTNCILHSAHPDLERANRCLNLLPLPPTLRLSANHKLKKPGWQNSPAKPTKSIDL